MKINLLISILLLSLLPLQENSYSQDKRTKALFEADFNSSGKKDIYYSQGYNNDYINAAWTPLSNTPNAVSRSCCTYIKIGSQEYIYQFGGGVATQLKSVARFNILSNTWSTSIAPMNLEVSSGTGLHTKRECRIKRSL